MIIEADVYLEHHGVKGMKWGVINEEEQADLRSKFTKFIEKQKHSSMNEPEEKIEDQGFFKSLTPAQKKAALIFGGAVVVAGLAYGAHHYNMSKVGTLDPRTLLDGDPFDGLRAGRSEGMLAYRDVGIHLPAGSLVARVSSDIESNIRPGGFYAAHELHDIESYKAFLGSVGGHTNYFKATEAISAPSTKEYVRLLGKAMDHPDVLKGRGVDIKSLNKLSTANREKALFRLATDELGKKDFAFALNSSTADGLLPKRFVSETLKAGYTSVIDYNNASGSVAQAPMRHLNGKMFKFFSSEPLTSEVKQLAMLNQDKNMDIIGDFYDAVKHSALQFINSLFRKGNEVSQDLQAFFEHHGIKENERRRLQGVGKAATGAVLITYGAVTLTAAKIR